MIMVGSQSLMTMVGSQCLMTVVGSQCLMTMVGSHCLMNMLKVSDDYGRVSVRHIAEQVGDRLAIVGAAHCLSKHHADLKITVLETF